MRRVQGPTVVALGGKSLVLRELRMPDLGELVRFANSFARERKSNPDLGIISMDRRVTAKKERTYLRHVVDGVRKKVSVSVACFDGKRVVRNCDISRGKSSDIRHTGLLGIAILDGYRGMGLGRAMIELALQNAFRIGVWIVELQVLSNNAPALNLYERTGFRKVGFIPGKIRHGGREIDEVRMYVDIRKIDKSRRGRLGRQ